MSLVRCRLRHGACSFLFFLAVCVLLLLVSSIAAAFMRPALLRATSLPQTVIGSKEVCVPNATVAAGSADLRKKPSICLNKACLLTDAEFVSSAGDVLFTSDEAAEGAELSVRNAPRARSFLVQHRNESGPSRPYSASACSGAGRQYLYIIKELYYIVNLGHLIGDEIFSTFHLLFELGLANIPRSDVWVVVSESVDQRFMFAKSIVNEHYNIISSNPVLFMDESDGGPYNIGGQPAYFQRLVFGWDRYGYAYEYAPEGTIIPSEAVVAAFRHRAMQLFALEDRVQPAPACSILFIVKDVTTAEHVFAIANVDELIAALRKRTHCSVEKVTWAGMPLANQVAAIFDKQIVISLMGSDLMNCIFQPLRSGIIVPDFCATEETDCPPASPPTFWNPNPPPPPYCVCKSIEVRLWFSHFPSRNVTRVPASGHGITWNGNIVTWDIEYLLAAVLQMHSILSSPRPI